LLALPVFLRDIEHTGLSTWLRTTDSWFGFYFVLLFHTIGLTLLAGASLVVDFRILGFAPKLPLKPLKPFFNVMWIGLWTNVASGLLLLTAYPTKGLTNPVFYVKMTLILLGAITMKKMYTQVFEDASLSEAAMMVKGKTLAKCSLVFWGAVITCGRLLPETARYLSYGHKGSA
jgi:hypothetical protein